MNHLDADTLTNLGTALQWQADVLDHVAVCVECREQFRDLGAMHLSFVPGPAIRAGFADAVVASLSTPVAAPARRAGLVWSSARALLGAAIAIVTLGLAAAQDAPLTANLAVIAAAALFGAIAAWRMPTQDLAG